LKRLPSEKVPGNQVRSQIVVNCCFSSGN